MSIEPGTLLGPVELRSVLHKEGASTLYEGYHARLGVEVRVRVMHGCPPEDRSRFLREARITAGLKHPALTRVIDFGEYGDARYLVTQRLRGTTLEQYLTEHKEPPSEKAIWKLLAEVTDVLRVCHSAGVAHRDLRPSDLMMTLDGQLRVSDVAIAPPSGTPATGPDGSFAERSRYLPPECARSDAGIEPAADLFALGVIAYQLAFQRLPYRNWIDEELSTDAAIEAPRFDLPTHCSLRLVHTIHKLIQPEPAARIDTASELLHLLPRATREVAPTPVAETPSPGAIVPPSVEPLSSPRGQALLWLERHFGAYVTRHSDTEIVHATLRERLIVWGLFLALISIAGMGLVSSI